FRANVLLSKLPNIPMDENTKTRFAAETKALRAYFYFQLVRMFGNIPLIITPISANDTYNITQAPREDVYAQIETDLEEAITILPNPNDIDVSTEGGRFTKGSAQALLGKVYLYNGKKAEA